MPSHKNRLAQFWQELKRRNVVRVITVYAGAVFVIIELINNITEPLRLPEWTPTFVIVLLAIGFPVVIIFSWIYDIHPEGGIVKTESADRVKTGEVSGSSNSWKIASYISFVVIVGLIVLNIVPPIGKKAILETSIAVLPFENLSDEVGYSHIGGAFTDEIITELQKIKEFDRVVSRTSTLQYETNRPTIPEIAEKLNVNYIVEGSIQRIEGHVRIRVQIIRAKNEDHIWANTYNEDYTKPEDIFGIQSRIAESVADELKVRITPEEKKRIETVPTTSLIAHDFYQRGRDEYYKYFLDQENKAPLNNAVLFYKRALELDPGYAQAYTSLALAYSVSFRSDRYRTKVFSKRESEIFRDSILSLVDKAFSQNEDLEEAYLVRSNYFAGIQQYDNAINELDRAIAINPNYALAYNAKSDILFLQQGKWIEGVEAKLMAISLERGALLPSLYRELGWFYEHMGFNNKATELYEQILQLTNDTIMYYEYMAGPEFCDRNWEQYISYCKKIIEMDPDRFWPYLELSITYGPIWTYDSAYYYTKKLIDFGENKVSYGGDYEVTVGRYYWEIGKRKEAVDLLDNARNYFDLMIDNREGNRDIILLSLAGIAYIEGEYEEALRQLNRIDLSSVKPQYFLIMLEMPDSFNDLHSDEQYQQILNTIKSKWQTEHEKARQWLEENDML